MALRSVQSVQLGAYMWRNGPNSVKTGSKWAHFTYLCTPKGPASWTHFSRIFAPKTAHFQGVLGFYMGPKCVTMGSQMVQYHFWKEAFLTHFCLRFWSLNDTFSRHFGICQRPKRVTTGSKRASLAAPQPCGNALKQFYCPLPHGNEAVYRGNSTSHSPTAVRR